LLLVVALVTACSSSAPPAAPATPAPATPAPTSAEPASEAPTPTDAASAQPATDAPSAGAGSVDRFDAGTTVVVSKDDVDYVEITVADVSVAESYEGDMVDDEPQVPGNVFIQAYAEYHALRDDTAYNSLDWKLVVDGVQQSGFTFLLNGPEPTLSFGTLAAGETAGGWLVYEVPPEGEVVVQWGDILVFQDGPVFEVLLRA
jgi:hypothetical protein